MSISSSIINVGELKQLLELQRMEVTTDSSGFMEEELVTFAKCRCKVEFDDRLMREVFKDDGIDTTIVRIFTIRYVPNVTIKDKILFKGNVYEIYGFNNINEENRFLKIWARAIEQWVKL